MSHGPLVVCSLYRPPNTDTTGFIKEFECFANSMLKEKLDWIVGTNHNMDFLKSNIHKNTQTFIDKILECRMIPTITQPTRISKTTATLIDNILITQKHCEWYDSCVLIDDISAHLPCMIRIRSYKASKKKVTYIESRDTRTKCVERLKENLSAINWQEMIDAAQSNNTDSIFQTFHSELLKQIDNFCPVTKCKRKPSELRKEPWVTGRLLKSIRHSKSLYKASIKNSAGKKKRDKYHNYMIVLKKTKKVAKKLYYINSCNEYKCNTK